MRYEKGTFITIPNKALMRTLTLGARAVFVEMCDMSDEKGYCFPSRKTLGERIQMATSSVDRFITELVDAGFITKTYRSGKSGDQTSNLYQINIIATDNDVPPYPPVGTPLTTHSDPPLTTHSALTETSILTKTIEIGEPEVRVVSYTKEDTDREVRTVDKSTLGYDSMCRWAEDKRGDGFRFVARTKQYKALKDAKTAGIKSNALKIRWEEMEEDDFWSEKGFDWTHVVASFNRKGV